MNEPHPSHLKTGQPVAWRVNLGYLHFDEPEDLAAAEVALAAAPTGSGVKKEKKPSSPEQPQSQAAS